MENKTGSHQIFSECLGGINKGIENYRWGTFKDKAVRQICMNLATWDLSTG
jgi:hypothetical protein